MRILFIGSIPTYQYEDNREIAPQEEPFVRACEELGYVTASLGHEIVIGDDNINSADHHIANGAIKFATNNPDSSTSFHINRSEGTELVFKSLPDNIVVNRHFHQEYKSTRPTGSLIPNLAALEASDILVMIGGKLTAKLLGNIAMDKEKPILAIPSFGGSAGELYENLRYLYRSQLKDHYNALSLLQSVWRDDSADSIIEMASILANKDRDLPPHGYFISYNWGNSDYADHVEVLLHRKKRRVNRDEGIFNAGADLTEVVRSLIDDSDTFIALWSQQFKDSSWCPNELEYARQRKHAGHKPDRIILLKIDETEPPVTAFNSIQLDGTSRELRELGIGKLTEHE